ncbi:CheR family methyltransferase [Thermophagus xiamenensis]|uniref:Chemotaxis protein methyltransferase CheR n=1 Tax=Thermophagus xiamenensis TaxID=385682 RepID=A0A1I1ZBV2_9BACT|nr:CheR family methyltransferase [Thermophagus xiamenensis]SFE29221.1 chemotaxis protein methyltransferase CheR [Thermophagus xiamenensis]
MGFILDADYNILNMGVSLSIKEIKTVTSEMSKYDCLDYSGHSFSFLKRRLGHIFSQLKIRRLTQFCEQLADENFRELINYHMAVNVTEMFRDPGFWRVLRRDVFSLFDKEGWSVWFPDTPSGEEVYSLLILLKEQGILNNVKVLCQHPSKEKCREISEGVIDQKKIEISYNNYRRLEEKDLFNNYFIEKEGEKYFNKELLEFCEFKCASVGVGDFNEKFDLILFRNSGINYTVRKKEELLARLLSNLKTGGIIALGVRESIPEVFHNQLCVLDRKESIFKKI